MLPDARRRDDELDAGEPVRPTDGNRDDDTLLAPERTLLALKLLRSPSTSPPSSAPRLPFPFRLGRGGLVTCCCGALDPGSSVSVSLSEPVRGRGARRPYVLRTRPDNIAIVVGEVMLDLAWTYLPDLSRPSVPRITCSSTTLSVGFLRSTDNLLAGMHSSVVTRMH